MNFVSFTFAVFFLAVFVLRLVCDRLGLRGLWLGSLAIASLVFYGWLVPWHVLLLLALAAGAYGAARTGRRSALVLAVTIALGGLAFFKYFDVLAWDLARLRAATGLAIPAMPRLGLALPLGISFYTFEAISYVVDVARGRVAPARRARDVLLFFAFFPHLIAGPIVRAGEFLYQIDRRRRPRAIVLAEGGFLMIRGYFLKVVVADNVGVYVDRYWSAAAEPGANASLAVLVTVLFAFQILCDFEGYSTIARGAAYLLGFRLPRNFDSPYIATTFQDFWRRWHMTLSRWLRDYLYVPLGGNRVGGARLYANLVIVMALGGLWHGAGDGFVVWGLLHGAALAIERVLGFHRLSASARLFPRLAWYVVVQTTVLIGWVFFRSPTIATATAILGNVAFGSYRALESSIPLAGLALALVVPVAGHARTFLEERFGMAPLSPAEKAVWGAVMLYAVCTVYGPAKTFIYFQF